jgi:hypothetical protein
VSDDKLFKPHLHPYTHFAFKTFSTTIPRRGKQHGKPQCRASVYEGLGGSHQCTRVGTVQDAGGYWWCGTHSPEGDASRRAKLEAKWAADRAARDAKWDRIAHQQRLAANAERYEAALRQIADGHNDPRSLAIEVLG